MLEANAVNDVLIHGPALQAVQVLVEPLVPLRQEQKFAVLTPMLGGGATNHLTADASPGELQVISDLGVHLGVIARHSLALAPRAGVAPDFDLPVYRQLRPLRPLAAMQARFLECLAGADVYLLSLILQPATALNAGEVVHDELAAAPLAAARRSRNLVGPGDHWGRGGVCCPFLPILCGIADGLDELRNPHQGDAILGVVGEEFVLPALLPGLLPACS